MASMVCIMSWKFRHPPNPFATNKHICSKKVVTHMGTTHSRGRRTPIVPVALHAAPIQLLIAAERLHVSVFCLAAGIAEGELARAYR
jgi:hypothetical protein